MPLVAICSTQIGECTPHIPSFLSLGISTEVLIVKYYTKIRNVSVFSLKRQMQWISDATTTTLSSEDEHKINSYLLRRVQNIQRTDRWSDQGPSYCALPNMITHWGHK